MARIMVDKDEFEELLAASQRQREDGEDMQAEEEEKGATPAAAADDDAEKGEGPDPDDEDDGDEGEGEEAEGGDDGDEGEEEEEDPVGKLPCRRRKQAAAFMRRLASGPQFGLRRGEIYLGGRLLGKVSTVLQHFFGPEKLTASQIRMAESFLSSKNKRATSRPEGERAPRAPAPAARSAAGMDDDDDGDDYHPELAAAWQKMGLFAGERSPARKGRRGKK